MAKACAYLGNYYAVSFVSLTASVNSLSSHCGDGNCCTVLNTVLEIVFIHLRGIINLEVSFVYTCFIISF